MALFSDPLKNFVAIWGTVGGAHDNNLSDLGVRGRHIDHARGIEVHNARQAPRSGHFLEMDVRGIAHVRDSPIAKDTIG